MTQWIDVHAHLEMLETAPEETIETAVVQGVKHMITIGTHPVDNIKVLEISKKFFPQVCCALGIHPHEAKFYTDEVETKLHQDLQEPCVVAVGEIGLDYYYEHSDREVQKTAFARQLQLAVEYDLPVEIHTRDAEADTIDILKKFKGKTKGLIHCFTGTQWLADEALALDFDISFSGIVTFKSAENLRNTLKTVPLDRLHIETDSPFLTPMPFRGKKNSPSFLVHTAGLVAQIKEVSLEDLSLQTRKNAQKLFKKLPSLS